MGKLIERFTAGTATATVRWDSQWGEYVVYLFGNNVSVFEATYHTDDHKDAIATAKAMLALTTRSD